MNQMKNYQKIERQKRDRNAPVYEDWLWSNKGSLFDIYERELFVRLVRQYSPRSIIDVGSGTGRIVEALASTMTHVVGIDFSSDSLQVLLRKEICNCSPVCANVAQLPIKTERFDLAVSCQVLPLMRREEMVMTLEEVYRILKPKGTFIFSVYNYHYWRHRGHSKGEDVPHQRFSMEFVHSLARKFDFDVKKIGFYKALPLRIFRHKQWIILDRFICSAPYLGRIASAYLVAIFQKEGNHGRY
jgi:ubiquinone/menaquinone biosynthesis C-methylase UbiE